MGRRSLCRQRRRHCIITYYLLPTFDEGRCEAGLLNGGVRDELHVEPVGGRLDVIRHLGTAELADESRAIFMSVPHLDVVVHAVIVVFHLEISTRRSDRVPDCELRFGDVIRLGEQRKTNELHEPQHDLRDLFAKNLFFTVYGLNANGKF